MLRLLVSFTLAICIFGMCAFGHVPPPASSEASGAASAPAGGADDLKMAEMPTAGHSRPAAPQSAPATQPAATSGEAVSLYHDQVAAKSTDGRGKSLVMTFDEVARYDRYSIVKVRRTSGASVPSVMFVVHGLYEMAKIRGDKYFINLKEWTDAEGDWYLFSGLRC